MKFSPDYVINKRFKMQGQALKLLTYQLVYKTKPTDHEKSSEDNSVRFA